MRSLLVAGVLVSTCIICPAGDGTQAVAGEVDAAPEFAVEGAGHLHIRAFPDHDDGFDIRRIYTGDEDFSMTVAEEDLEFPYAYHLEGVVVEPNRRWRILAWRSRIESTDWVRPGEPYGHTSFEWHDPRFVDFALYEPGPPP